MRISKRDAPAATCRSDADAGDASLRLRMTSRRRVAAVLTPGGTGVEGETARFRAVRCCLRHPDGCAAGCLRQPCADEYHPIAQTRVALVGGSNANPLDDARDPRKTSIILAAYRAPTRSDAAAGPPAQRQTRKDAPFRRLPSSGKGSSIAGSAGARSPLHAGVEQALSRDGRDDRRGWWPTDRAAQPTQCGQARAAASSPPMRASCGPQRAPPAPIRRVRR